MKMGLIWTAHAAFLTLVFGLNHFRVNAGCGPPSAETSVMFNEVALCAVTSNVISSWPLKGGNPEDLQQSLQQELRDRTVKLFSYRAETQVAVSPDGCIEVWLEYPPNEWLADLNLDYRAIWVVDFEQGRVLSRPPTPSD